MIPDLRGISKRNAYLIGLFTLGFLYSLFSSWHWTDGTYWNNVETVDIGLTLAKTGAFANPYQTMATGPTAHLPPLYPAFLGLLFTIFGKHDFRMMAVLSLIIAALFGLSMALLPTLSQRIFGSRFPGYFAALAMSMLPIVQIPLGWEVVPFAVSLVALCSFSLSPKPNPWLAGAMAAAISLMNAPGTFFVVVWMFGLLLARRLSRSFVLKALSFCALLCLPWLARNYVVLGSFCIRDTSPLELQVSNNDDARALLRENVLHDFNFYHPNQSFSQAMAVKQLGEIEYNHRKLQLVKDWIATHPARFADLTLKHFVLFWLPDPQRFFAPAIWVLTLLSLPALFSSLRKLGPASVLTASLITYSLPYIFVQSDLRYRSPVLWISVLFAGQSIALAKQRWPAQWDAVAAWRTGTSRLEPLRQPSGTSRIGTRQETS